MKILIIGEFSGFAKNLAKGFRALGHEPLLFSWGDSFKSIEKDENTYLIDVKNIKLLGKSIKGTNRIKRPFVSVKLRHYISQLGNDWDCAFVIGMGFLQLGNNYFNDLLTVKEIQSRLKDKNNIYLSASGGDFIFYSHYHLSKYISPAELNKAQKIAPLAEEGFNRLIGYFYSIIPISNEYEEAYRYYIDKYHYNVHSAVPLPYDVESVKYSNTIKDKIVIMHGINRYYEKGSDYMVPAMKRIEADFPDKVKIEIVERLPLNEYLSVMERCNILLDQCYAGNVGMNAIEALAMGKVVLGGNKYNLPGVSLESPVVDIVADQEQIYNALKKLVLNPKLIIELSHRSREYACEVHDCRKVAQKYVDIFSGRDWNGY